MRISNKPLNTQLGWHRKKSGYAVHLRDEGLHRLPNGEIFQKAISESRILLTFDLDFGEIEAASKGSPVQVIVFHLRNTRALSVIDRLTTVIAQLTVALARRAVISVEEFRYRIRFLPIGSTER